MSGEISRRAVNMFVSAVKLDILTWNHLWSLKKPYEELLTEQAK